MAPLESIRAWSKRTAEGADLAWPPSSPSKPQTEEVDLAWPSSNPSKTTAEGVDLAWPPSSPSELRTEGVDLLYQAADNQENPGGDTQLPPCTATSGIWALSGNSY